MAQASFLYPFIRFSFFLLLGNVRAVSLCCVKIPTAALDSTAEGKIEGHAEE